MERLSVISRHLSPNNTHWVMVYKTTPKFTNKGTLKNKTIVITGGSRGIGKEMAVTFAKDGANIAILAKTAEAHPKLPGTIYTTA